MKLLNCKIDQDFVGRQYLNRCVKLMNIYEDVQGVHYGSEVVGLYRY